MNDHPEPAPTMPAKKEKDPILTEVHAAVANEREAVEFFEGMRWPDGVSCPRCGSVEVRQMQDREGNRNARYLWRCTGGCKKQFTVRVGTILEDSPIPLKHWAFVVWMACAGKKGVSAKQIERQIRVSYKTALYMLHRVRFGMIETGGAKLVGTVEVDETFVGGKARRGDRGPDGRGRRRPGSQNKTPVVAAVERTAGGKVGKVRTRVVADVTSENLAAVMRENIQMSSVIVTDEGRAYPKIAQEWARHETVTHGVNEFARTADDGFRVHTNTAEGFFSLLKRAINGTYHHVSRVHLHRYCTHQEFLYNTRGGTDGERIATLIRQCDGKRLTRKALALKPEPVQRKGPAWLYS